MKPKRHMNTSSQAIKICLALAIQLLPPMHFNSRLKDFSSLQQIESPNRLLKVLKRHKKQSMSWKEYLVRKKESKLITLFLHPEFKLLLTVLETKKITKKQKNSSERFKQ